MKNKKIGKLSDLEYHYLAQLLCNKKRNREFYKEWYNKAYHDFEINLIEEILKKIPFPDHIIAYKDATHDDQWTTGVPYNLLPSEIKK